MCVCIHVCVVTSSLLCCVIKVILCMFSSKLQNFAKLSDIKNFHEISEDTDLISYIDNCTNNILPDYTIFTCNFQAVREAIAAQRSKIVVVGPKGCGKTLMVAVIFMILYKNFDCLCITPRTFDPIYIVPKMFELL